MNPRDTKGTNGRSAIERMLNLFKYDAGCWEEDRPIESVNHYTDRLLKDFETRGLVRLSYHRVEFIDPARLRKAAATTDAG